MVSDQVIAQGVLEILSLRQSGVSGGGGGGGVGSDTQNGGVSSVVQQLGAKFGLDLTHKSAFIAEQINLLRHFPQQQQFPPPQAPPSVYQSDHFALQNHPQFLHHFYYHQQQQQQQQQQNVLPSSFNLQFGEYPPHVPPPQHHVTATTHHHQQQQLQQHVAPPPAPVKNVGPTGKAASKESTQSGTKKRAGTGGLNKLCGVTPELQAIVGEATMARTEIVKQLWAYIRKNNLQDPSNRRKIICDEALRVVLETDSTDMFKMNKLLAKHILRLGPRKEDSTEESAPSKRQKLDDESTSLPASLPADTVIDAEIAKCAETSDGASSIVISDALARFLGTTRREMLASEAIQHVCEYVKFNSLEDIDSLTVVCDEKLRELLGCERISMLEINETLARHHLLKSS